MTKAKIDIYIIIIIINLLKKYYKYDKQANKAEDEMEPGGSICLLVRL